jgi:hypothetical protein
MSAMEADGLIGEAAETYVAYLLTAYGFTREEVEVPEAYSSGREIDWFGHLNDALSALEGYSEPEVRRILTARNPWVDGGGSLLDLLRAGDARAVRRILRRY